MKNKNLNKKNILMISILTATIGYSTTSQAVIVGLDSGGQSSSSGTGLQSTINKSLSSLKSLDSGGSGSSITSSLQNKLIPSMPSVATPFKSTATSSFSFMDPGGMVTGYCGSPPLASASGLTRGLSQLDASNTTQITNATNILANKILTMNSDLKKASVANSQRLKGMQSQQKQLTETKIKYDEAQKKALNIAKKKDAVAAEMDINKLNSTNGCAIADNKMKALIGEQTAQELKGKMDQGARDYNRSVKGGTAGYNDIYADMIKNDKSLDDIPPTTQITPTVLTPEQIKKEMHFNKIMGNPNPAPETKTKALKDTPKGTQYTIAKRILDRKSEAVQSVLNYKTAQNSPTVPAPTDDKALMVFLNKYDSGLKDKNGQPIYTNNVIETKDGKQMTSPASLLGARVKYFTENPDYWHNVVTKLNSPDKLEENLKMQSLQIKLLYNIYNQTLVANRLKVLSMQNGIQGDNKKLSSFYTQLQNQ